MLTLSLQRGLKADQAAMTFSRDGFFGYALALPASTPVKEQQVMFWSTHATNTPPPRDLPSEDLRAILVEKYGSWRSLTPAHSVRSSTLHRNPLTPIPASRNGSSYLAMNSYTYPTGRPFMARLWVLQQALLGSFSWAMQLMRPRLILGMAHLWHLKTLKCLGYCSTITCPTHSHFPKLPRHTRT